MDLDGDSKKNNKIKKKRTSNSISKGYVPDVSSVLQSFWIRCRTIFPNSTDGKFMESELRFVLYCGVIFWAIYLLYQIVT
jgi:hypothetical protein